LNPPFNIPYVKIGAIVTGGSTNSYTILSPPGWGNGGASGTSWTISNPLYTDHDPASITFGGPTATADSYFILNSIDDPTNVGEAVDHGPSTSSISGGNLTFSTNLISRSPGPGVSFVLDGFRAGQVILVTGASNSNNNRAFKILNVAEYYLQLSSNVGAAEGPSAGVVIQSFGVPVIVKVNSSSFPVPVITASGLEHTPDGTPFISLYSGETVTFTANITGSLCDSYGLWTCTYNYDNGVTGVGTGVRAGSITIAHPGTIGSPLTTIFNYQPDEDPGYHNINVIVNLVPGARPTSTFNFDINSLPSGEVAAPYQTGSIPDIKVTTNGGTGFAITYNAFPDGLAFTTVTTIPSSVTDPGLILGTPTVATSTPVPKFTVTAHDNTPSPNTKYISRTFSITIAPTATVRIDSLAPPTGSIVGATPVTVTGAGFKDTDSFVFVVVDQATNSGKEIVVNPGTTGAHVVYTDSTHLIVTTPSWATLIQFYPVNPPTTSFITDVYIKRGTSYLAHKGSGYTFTTDIFSGTVSPLTATVDQVTGLVVTVAPTNETVFDSNCSVTYTPSWAPTATQTYKTSDGSLALSSGNLIFTLPPSNFVGHPDTTAAVVVYNKVTSPTKSFPNPATQNFNVLKSTLNFNTGNNPDKLPPTTRGAASYTGSFIPSGGRTSPAYVFTLFGNAPLPVGLHLETNGTFSGSVGTGADSAQFSVSLTDGTNTIVKDYYIQITGGVLSFLTTTLPDAVIGSTYPNYDIKMNGGVGNFTFGITPHPDSLPIDLSFNTSLGEIFGPVTNVSTPNKTYQFTVTCTDETPTTVSRDFQITVKPQTQPITISSIAPTHGYVAGGTSVTITGVGFASGCSVTFGSVDAGVTFISGTQLIAISPPASSPSVVIVNVVNKDTGIGHFNSFTYELPLRPNITDVNKQDGPFAGGQAIILSGDFFLGVTSVKFGLLNDATAISATKVVIDATSNQQTISLETPSGFSFGNGSIMVPVSIFVENSTGVGEWSPYNYRPPPIITSVVPSSGLTTGGNIIYITGKNFFTTSGGDKPRVFIGNVEVNPNDVVLVEAAP
jgi:hypothetical protein